MPEVRYSSRFVDHVAGIYSERVLREIRNVISTVTAFPGIGSTNVRPFLIREYGPNLRKIPVGSFILVYRYDETTDLLEFVGLPHARLVR